MPKSLIILNAIELSKQESKANYPKAIRRVAVYGEINKKVIEVTTNGHH